MQSFCVVPLTTALGRLGAMGFGSLQTHEYHDSEIAFMQEVAKQVAVAVDNVLHDESARSMQTQLARERDRFRLLLEVNNAVVSHLNMDDVFASVSASLQKVIHHDGCSLMLYEPDTGQYRCHVLKVSKNESFVEEGRADKSMKSPGCIAFTTRAPAVFSEQDLIALSSESKIAQHLLAEGVKSFCSIPLQSHDRILGTLNIGRLREDAFTRDDVELLTQVAQQIAIARRERARVSRDRRAQGKAERGEAVSRARDSERAQLRRDRRRQRAAEARAHASRDRLADRLDGARSRERPAPARSSSRARFTT